MSKMRFPEHASGWYGLALLFSALASGCAALPGYDGSGDEIAYLTRALEAQPAALNAMMVSAHHDDSIDGKLHVALLKSVPGYAGYDPSGSVTQLRALQQNYGGTMVGAVAHMRLAELAQEYSCRQQNDALRRRLHKVVDIERSLDGQPR